MKLLLDSHTLYWSLYDPARIPPVVEAVITDSSSELFISHISIWELIDKAIKARLPLAGNAPDAILERIKSLAAITLPIELEDILTSIKLPQHHGDPFDRMLIAQAQRLDAALLSKDGKFKLYDVPVIWA